MRAVIYRLRAVLREHRLSTLGLAAAVAVVVGVVLAFAAGAERTSTVADRYTTAQGRTFDGVIYQEGGRSVGDEIAALPGAATVGSASFVFGALVEPTGEPLDSATFSGSYLPIGMRLIAGRDADPDVASEFVASRKFIEVTHASIGSTYQLVTLTQATADAQGMAAPEPDGPSVEAVLVGIYDGPTALDDPTPSVVFSPALLDDPTIGVAVSIISVGFKPGVDLTAFRAQLDTLPSSDRLSLEEGVLVSDSARSAINAQALGLWVLAGVAGLAAIGALGQLITRNVRLSDSDRMRLSAVGYVDRQMAVECVARAAIPVVGGTVAGVAIAIGLSSRFPAGFVRTIEPDPGVRIETAVLGTGAALFVVAVIAWLLIALTVRRSSARQREHPSYAVEAIATRAGAATASTGLRFAFTRGDRDRGSAPTVIAGLALLVTGLVGALTFATSLVRLVDEPARYGSNFDVMFGAGADSLPDEMRVALDTNPDIDAVLLYAEGQARHGADTLRLLGMEPIRGEIGPPVLEGRLPASEDEIALGRLAAESLGVGVGDELQLDGDEQSERYRVTGLAVVPSIGLNDGIGQDGVMTLAGVHRVNPDLPETAAVVKFRDGTTLETIRQLMVNAGPDSGSLIADPGESRPVDIVNIERVRSIPFVLAAVLAALVLLTLGHATVTSVQNRRRDVAVLRSIGADRRWIGRAVVWQATSFTLLPLLVGVPAGIIIGRITFRAFADSIGTINDASVPILYALTIVLGMILLADAIAWAAARRGYHRLPAVLLRAE
ncbi:MAG TPA: ABC transporter permease [Ilumatobacteraceae bacterium]